MTIRLMKFTAASTRTLREITYSDLTRILTKHVTPMPASRVFSGTVHDCTAACPVHRRSGHNFRQRPLTMLRTSKDGGFLFIGYFECVHGNMVPDPDTASLAKAVSPQIWKQMEVRPTCPCMQAVVSPIKKAKKASPPPLRLGKSGIPVVRLKKSTAPTPKHTWSDLDDKVALLRAHAAKPRVI